MCRRKKNLPIFGRGEEQKRRERLAREIKDFNKELADVRSHATADVAGMWEQYRGAILNPDSLERANTARNRTSNVAESARWDFGRTHRGRDAIASEQKRYADKKEQLDNAKATFETQQKKMRDLSRRHMGRDQTGELTPVTDDMSADEKRAVRAKNRKTLNDKLAARKGRKPAKNLAEMLANADIER